MLVCRNTGHFSIADLFARAGGSSCSTVYLYDAIGITPSIPEAVIASLIAKGIYIQVENDDPRGEPGYLARRPGTAVGIFVVEHHEEDGTVTPAGITIEADWHLEFTKEARPVDTVAAEVAQIINDVRAASRVARQFSGQIVYEASTYSGPGPADYTTDTKVIEIRAGSPVILTGQA